MNFVRIAALAGGIVSGTALAVALLQMSAADQPSPIVQEPDPCEGQTDEQCHQTIDKLRSDGNAKYINWIDDFIASGQDVRSLPRHPSSALPKGPPPTIELAVEGAAAIVVGIVSDVAFEVVPPDEPSGHAFVRTTARVAIEDTLKGDAAKEITIVQFGGPEPNPDLKTGHLLYTEAAPLMLEGDRALLFLKEDEFGYSVEVWTGTYLVDKEDKLDAVTGNPFEASAEAKTLSEFSAEIATLVAEQAESAR